MPCCLAIDIGASSGRHILGELVDGRIVTTEIYRFENGFSQQQETLVWDLESLVRHVVQGISLCKQAGKIPQTVAIDTWGVDYVLLDDSGQEILPCVSYRDHRTAGVPQKVYELITKEKLYEITGIQTQAFNTIFQLYCDQKSGKLQQASRLLMMPEYLSYRLTGVMKNEYTNATTTGLVNARTRQIDEEILEALHLPKGLFGKLQLPGTTVGDFSPAIAEQVGFNARVVLCPSHDTAAAVAACPLEEASVFISSGTWSLVGTENEHPITSPQAMEANFTNEGGIEYRFRFLKNIMGMWLFQNIRKNLNGEYTYDQMMEMAMSSEFEGRIDPTDEAFLAPENMVEAIRNKLGMPQLPLPDVLACVYQSLAQSYCNTVAEIEAITQKPIQHIAIVGGGSKDRYLNWLTAQITGKRVTVGPTEGTALGNLISQFMALNSALTLPKARSIIKNTLEIKTVL